MGTENLLPLVKATMTSLSRSSNETGKPAPERPRRKMATASPLHPRPRVLLSNLYRQPFQAHIVSPSSKLPYLRNQPTSCYRRPIVILTERQEVPAHLQHSFPVEPLLPARWTRSQHRSITFGRDGVQARNVAASQDAWSKGLSYFGRCP
jgi:hypothetical protein